MISREYLIEMAAYNRWQNENLYRVATDLGDSARRMDRGSFFGSIHSTLNHILWADQFWMHRLIQAQPPSAASIADSLRQYDAWSDLAVARKTMDGGLEAWAKQVEPAWLSASLTYFSGAMGRELTKPHWLLATHVFNHQTHHRGQVHAMITAAGGKPTDTDLTFRP